MLLQIEMKVVVDATPEVAIGKDNTLTFDLKHDDLSNESARLARRTVFRHQSWCDLHE